ncbi:MAG: hypothetical protein IAE84_04625 [Saprospiraceae bacterium]|nr:hypothetical protein [Saprospiraceae bacterium]
MKSSVADALKQARMGQPVQFKNLTVFPLFEEANTPFTYLTMRSALEKGWVEITELNEGGSVPVLKVINRSDALVLLLDGEELRGAKQNRIVNTSILLPAQSETAIPVSCTERGRWHYNSRQFSESGYMMSSMSRNSKNARMYCRMMAMKDEPAEASESHRAYDAGQGEVWSEISALHGKLRTSSHSDAMSDAYEQRSGDINAYVAAFPLQPGQNGMVALLNGKPISADMLSQPDAYADIHEKLIRSLAVELIGSAQDDSTVLSPEDMSLEAYKFLHTLYEGHEAAFQPVGLGEDLRYDIAQAGGAALTYQDALVHLNIYSKEKMAL